MSAFAEPQSRFLDVRGSRLHYVLRGDPGAPPLVLVHGMRDQARSWDWIAQALANRFHVIAPDLRGHGDSFRADPTAYTMAAFVLDLADLADALALARFDLVGHSLGGAIALRYAGAFAGRVRTLCAIEGIELPIVRDERANPKPFPERLRGWIESESERRQRSPRAYATRAQAERRMAEEQPGFDPATIAHLVEHGLLLGSDGLWRWKYDNAARLRAPDDADGRDLDQTLAAIRCPTLLAYGLDSWIPLPPAERLALLRDHRLATFPGAGHWLHHQARDAFLTALTSFLDLPKQGPSHA